MSANLAITEPGRGDLTAAPTFMAKVENAITYLSGVMGEELVAKSSGALKGRIVDYARNHGLTIADVSAAFRVLASPEVSARIQFKNQLLAEFSAAVVLVMGERRAREEQEHRRQEAERDRAWRESPEGIAELERANKWLRDYCESFGTLPGRKRKSGHNRGERRDDQEEAGRQAGGGQGI